MQKQSTNVMSQIRGNGPVKVNVVLSVVKHDYLQMFCNSRDH